MTATAADALLADIVASPEDDGLRLVYADWLEDDGQPERAEFIRLQIAHEWYPGGPMEGFRAGRDQDELGRRERELLEPGLLRHLSGPFWVKGDEWGWSMGAHNPRAMFRGGARRGFVAEVACPLAAWRQHGPALVRAQPLERVTPGDCGTALVAMGGGGVGWDLHHLGRLLGEAGPPEDSPWGASLLSALWRASAGRQYDSVEEANLALSDAALAWAGGPG